MSGTDTAVSFGFGTSAQRSRRKALIRALRQPMPEMFSWDFDHLLVPSAPCGSSGCALGLASMLWPADEAVFLDGDDVVIGEFFGMWEAEVAKIFFGENGGYDGRVVVTPEMVAEKLEELG